MFWIGIIIGMFLGVALFMLIVVLCGASTEGDNRSKKVTYD
jgi:hypothetical protein